MIELAPSKLFLSSRQMVATLIAIILSFGVLLVFVSIAGCFVSIFVVASRRKATTSFLSAIASRNVMFRPELYHDEARWWSSLHLWSFVSVFVSLFVSGLAAILLKMVE